MNRRWKSVAEKKWIDVQTLNRRKRRWVADVETELKITIPILKQVLLYCGDSITRVNFSMLPCPPKRSDVNFVASKDLLSVITKWCPNLRSLDISSLNATEDGLEHLMGHAHKLIDLGLSTFVRKCKRELEDILSTLFAKCKNLQDLWD